MEDDSRAPSSRSISVIRPPVRKSGRPGRRGKDVAQIKIEEEEEDELAWSDEKGEEDSEFEIEDKILSMHRKVSVVLLLSALELTTHNNFSSQRCDKCLDVPAQELLRRISKRKPIQRKRKIGDELMEDETAYALRLGGWMSCLKCCSAYHWVGHEVTGSAMPYVLILESLALRRTALASPAAYPFSKRTSRDQTVSSSTTRCRPNSRCPSRAHDAQIPSEGRALSAGPLSLWSRISKLNVQKRLR